MVVKKLLIGLKSSGGRNNKGRITAYHRGGGHKRKYRFIDFERKLEEIPGVIKSIERDPNRSANIALVSYSNGLVSYVIAPEGLKVGDIIISGLTTIWEALGVGRLGSIIKIQEGKVGEYLSNIEYFPGTGAQVARAAGGFVQFIKKYEENNKVLLKLKSGEYRIFEGICKAMIGIVSNEQNINKSLVKAGNTRWLGKRPIVRGVAMNPVDHPHGGGEGKKSGKGKTPWGWNTKGTKTSSERNKKLIIRKKK